MTSRIAAFICLLVLSSSALTGLSQSLPPDHWEEIIRQPWYTGTVDGKHAFMFVDENDRTIGYFFVATTSLPKVYAMEMKWKGDYPRSVSFLFRNKKVKAKFRGSVDPDTIAGILSTSRKTAIHLGIPPELSLFLAKETLSNPPSRQVMDPSLHSHDESGPIPHRYLSPVFPSVLVTPDVSFGMATGYYVSMPVETEGYDYQQILLDAMEKMYVNPTKDAILHIFNKDPLSFALTDLQPLRLDIYQPAGDEFRRRPLILLLHGGAFILGDKATPTIQELAEDFTKKGYVVATVNYRMGFNPASKSSLERSAYRAVQDARAALRFLAYNASYYGIDPDYVLLGGSSAGAITALNTAFMEESERPESSYRNLWRAQLDLGGLDESTNEIQASYTVRGVVNLWGAVNDTAIIDLHEPVPVLSIHGDADRIVPYDYAYPFLDLDTSITSNIVTKLYGSLPIHRRLQNLGTHSELLTLAKAGHEPQFEPWKYDVVMSTIISRATKFYFKALFGFPEITGPDRIAIATAPPTYNVIIPDDVTCYWQADGGKIIPGGPENAARIVWLTGTGSGKVTAVLEHRDRAVMEIDVPIEIPSPK